MHAKSVAFALVAIALLAMPWQPERPTEALDAPAVEAAPRAPGLLDSALSTASMEHAVVTTLAYYAEADEEPIDMVDCLYLQTNWMQAFHPRHPECNNVLMFRYIGMGHPSGDFVTQMCRANIGELPFCTALGGAHQRGIIDVTSPFWTGLFFGHGRR